MYPLENSGTLCPVQKRHYSRMTLGHPSVTEFEIFPDDTTAKLHSHTQASILIKQPAKRETVCKVLGPASRTHRDRQMSPVSGLTQTRRTNTSEKRYVGTVDIRTEYPHRDPCQLNCR
ncbi:hypothetical protein GX50_06628 [[Emmonsia] crescens]|uniref:Uncharacterized protein n=1 Tax=[Emmonsia] crescens TaxID=73230 RepID=A0A2B7ZB47_9EURO|nr:hypothetical protein GX50_06628 [Emmonsia crescens]